MPVLQNPFYASPIADALANLSKTFASGPTEAQRIGQAEQALKLKTERENLAKVSDVFGMYGQPGFDRNAAMSAAVLAGYDPTKLADMERYGSANTYGATDPRTTNAFVGAGGAYGSTGAGFREGQAAETARNNARIAENKYEFEGKPYAALDANGNPVIATNKTAVGMSPVLSDTETKGTMVRQNWNNLGDLTPAQTNYVGADAKNPPAPKNYITPDGKVYQTADGITDLQTGQKLPPGGYVGTVQGGAGEVGLTDPNRTKVQASAISLDRLEKTADYVDSLSADPTNFGPAGIVKGLSQNVAQAVDGIAKGLGYSGVDAALNDARSKLIAAGVNPSIISGVFDPTLPKLNQAYALLLYQGAAALAGQSGRDISNADVNRMKGIIGDPESFFASQQSMASGMAGVRRFIADQRAVNQKYLNPQGGTSGTPPPSQPPPNSGASKVIRIDQNGKIIP